MKRKLLAVSPPSINYAPYYDVEIASSFENAEEMIIAAELRGEPYADLDLPVYHEERFWEFIEWMEKTDRRYHFSIFGTKNNAQFFRILKIVREKGFHFNT